MSSSSRPTPFETALIAGGIVLFLAMLWNMEAFLSPPVLAMAGVIFLWPLRKNKNVRAVFLAGAFLLTLWFLHRLSGVLVPFVVVYLLAFMFDPLVTALDERHGIRRWISSLGVTVVTLGAVVVILVLLVPNIIGQVQTLISRIAGSVGALREWLATSDFLDRLEASGFIEKQVVIDQITTTIQQQSSALMTNLPETIEQLLASIGSLLGTLAILAIIPIILFYTLKDYPHLRRRIVELFPTFGGRRDYLVEAGAIVGSYLRGILIICAIAAFNVSVALMLLGVPFGLLIGLMVGILTLVPNLGAVISTILALLIAFIFGDPWYIDATYVLIVLLGQSLLETTVLSPHILSYQVGLHPVLVLLSLFVFGSFMGILGLVIAVPTTALLMTVYKAHRENWSIELLSRHRVRDSIASRLRQWREEQKEEMLGRTPKGENEASVGASRDREKAARREEQTWKGEEEPSGDEHTPEERGSSDESQSQEPGNGDGKQSQEQQDEQR